MDLLILGGNSQSNQAWIQDVSDEFKDVFNKRIDYDYIHWLKGQRSLNHQTELKRLADLSVIDNYAVFAKSAGTVLLPKPFAKVYYHLKNVYFWDCRWR